MRFRPTPLAGHPPVRSQLIGVALKGRVARSVPEAGREMAFCQIVEQGQDTSRSLATGDTFNAHHVSTRRLANKKP
jgi:hypothetical protein